MDVDRSPAGDRLTGPSAPSKATTRAFLATREDADRAVDFVAESLSDHPDPWLLPRAVVLARELIDNAVVHARSEFEVTVRVDAGGCRVSVSDRSDVLPLPTRPDRGHNVGGGTRLLGRLSSAWGSELTPHGKAVWFAVNSRTGPQPHRSGRRGGGRSTPPDTSEE